MPIDLPKRRPAPRAPRPGPFDRDAQAAYITMAFAGDDPAAVSLAIKEVATMQRILCALDENPPLSEIMRALRKIGLEFVIQPLVSPD